MDYLMKDKRFSFLYNGKNAWDCEYSAVSSTDGDTVTTVYDFPGGLRITNIAKKVRSVWCIGMDQLLRKHKQRTNRGYFGIMGLRL